MYEHDLNSAFSRIKADEDLKDRIWERIEEREMKQTTIKRTRKATAVIICAAALCLTTAFAASPAGQEAIGSVIDYFKNTQAVEVTDIDTLNQYNSAIGASVTKDGYTLTLDNVSADDNFVHVFYTLTTDGEPFFTGGTPEKPEGMQGSTWVDCMIDGQVASGNNSMWDSYFADNRTYKAVQKFSVATREIPDHFKIELLGMNENAVLDLSRFDAFGDFYQPGATLSDEEKSKILYVSADIDKSAVKLNSVTKEIHQKLWNGSEVEKAVFSPFGNQVVLKTPPIGEDDNMNIDGFALFDENNRSLDIINSGLTASSEREVKNSFEFLKADAAIKQLKFVPIECDTDNREEIEVLKQAIGTYPISYKVSDYGNVVVTGVRFSDGEVDVDYYKDGFVLYDPGFSFLDENGEDAMVSEKQAWVQMTDVHQKNGTYTARYVYDPLDDEGNHLPTDDSVSAENLRKKFKVLGTFDTDYIHLNFDKAVVVDLQ